MKKILLIAVFLTACAWFVPKIDYPEPDKFTRPHITFYDCENLTAHHASILLTNHEQQYVCMTIDDAKALMDYTVKLEGQVAKDVEEIEEINKENK